MFCDQCGKEIKQGIKFCPNCGAPVQPLGAAPMPARETEKIEPRKPQHQKKEKKFPLIPVLCALLLLLVVGGGGFYVYQSGVLEDAADWIGAAHDEKDDDRDTEEEPEAQEPEEEPEGEPAEESEERTEVPAADEEPAQEPAQELAVPEVQQEIVVNCSGSTALLTLMEWEDGLWVERMRAQAQIGSNGISAQKQEGDHCTPAGTFAVLFCFSDQAQDTGLPCVQVRSGDVWVCDPDSCFYNTLQSENLPEKDWDSSENMYDKFTKNRSVACIYFAYNGDGQTAGSAAYNGGSALFLDGVGSAGKMDSGYGDIKISAADMTALLRSLDAGKHPVITIS